MDVENATTAELVDADLSWQLDGLCAQTDPEAFFPEKGGSTREARRICGGCEVRAECLAYALAHDERFGVWGGLSERERRKLLPAAGRGARSDLRDGMCQRGLHAMSGANVVVSGDGFRRCLPCRRVSDADRNARRKAARAVGRSSAKAA